jgi:hypothetical protein
VGGEQDRGAQGGKLPDDIPGTASRARVEAGRRLVEEKDPGVPDDAEGEIQPPLLPAGQRLDFALLLPVRPTSAITSPTSRGFG